ncbi:MAG: UDP-N-acetylmuramoyl-L-alanyl-D-glutamate--2,6-diaminopimelate ligase [Saprospiraceae bacterium]|nr:UDP-N-acetylmuramoyl-L-alanyl-D-glutamate--2,6-diaminopimelate ligase [Candidatus Vicinibacter affinis]
MKSLSQILPQSGEYQIFGTSDHTVGGFSSDSREVGSGVMFVARKGLVVDGHAFIPEVIDKGVKVILCEELPIEIKTDVCYVRCANLLDTLTHLLNKFYDYPSDQLKLIGITGTNGKTTTATLCYELFKSLGYKTGLISTVINRIHLDEEWATHTTPDIIKLYSLLDRMVKEGCSYVFMEVSSHALDQNRIAGLNFSGAVFTNLTHDHLDYHKTFDSYIKAKKKFFDGLSKASFALINSDDIHGQIMVQNCKAKIYTYALRGIADFKIKVLENNLHGLHLKYKHIEWFSRLVGVFNGYNLAAVLGVAILLGEDENQVLQKMSDLKSVDGRFDWMRNESDGRVGIVDYAHTPDAVEKILSNIQELRKTNQKIITVIGCGGNRDRDKRPEMARIATELSDQLILTSDNPRDEDPADIIRQMETGISDDNFHKYLIVIDREQAIKTACSLSQKGDIILLAGKGHEKYQEIKGVKTFFDDKEKLRKYLLNI